MVRLKGFEPLAYGLEVRCSIQLSYRRIPYLTLAHLTHVLIKVYKKMHDRWCKLVYNHLY